MSYLLKHNCIDYYYLSYKIINNTVYVKPIGS